MNDLNPSSDVLSANKLRKKLIDEESKSCYEAANKA